MHPDLPTSTTPRLERSFDFSKSPNLQEVDIALCWMGGRLLWIPAALSTLGRVTSPYLSVIKLRFTRVRSVNRPTRTLIKSMGDDLQWITDEFARIEREFEGAVSFTVIRDSGFEELDTLKVSKLSFLRSKSYFAILSTLRSFPTGLSELRSLKLDLRKPFSLVPLNWAF